MPIKFPLICLGFYLSTFILFPGLSNASSAISLQSESLIRFLERDTTTENDARVVPAYEYIQFDINNGPVTFHANAWGRADLTDNGFFSDQTAGELLYGYLEYRPGGRNFFTRLGRQSVFAGVANESIDGIYIDTALPAKMAFSVYAGQPASLDSTDGRDGDSIYGGRFSIRNKSIDFGISYKLIKNNRTESEEMAGIDYGFMLNNLFVGGLSSYNLITEDFAEHSFDTVVSVNENRFRVFYQLFTFEDYFGTGANNANPFRVLALTAEELSSYGLEISRKNSEAMEFGIKLTRNDYDLEDASHYAALLASWNSGSINYGGELGVSEGENGRNDMMIARGYVSARVPQSKIIDRVSLDILYAAYDQAIFGKDTSFFAAIAGTRNITDRLLMKLSADYESNPYYDTDIRGLVSLSYNYSAN